MFTKPGPPIRNATAIEVRLANRWFWEASGYCDIELPRLAIETITRANILVLPLGIANDLLFVRRLAERMISRREWDTSASRLMASDCKREVQ